jgi:hypothetical protein
MFVLLNGASRLARRRKGCTCTLSLGASTRATSSSTRLSIFDNLFVPILVPLPGGDIRGVIQCYKVIFPPDAKRDGVFFELGAISVGVQLLGEFNEAIPDLSQTTLQHRFDGVQVNVRQ